MKNRREDVVSDVISGIDDLCDDYRLTEEEKELLR